MNRAKVRVILLAIVVPLVAAVAIFLLSKVYLSRPEAVVRLSQLLSRSLGIEVHIGGIEAPLGWTDLGTVVLYDVAVVGPSAHTPLFLAHRVQLRPYLLPLLRREWRFRWIEVERPELQLVGASVNDCQAAFASLGRALEGWASLTGAAHRLPVDRLTLKRGIVAVAGFRLTDVELHAEDWGRPAYRVRLAGRSAYAGGSLPFQLEVQGSTPSEPAHFDPTMRRQDRGGGPPLQVAAKLRLERGALALLQPMLPTLSLSTARAAALLTVAVAPGKQMEGNLEAGAEELFIQGAEEPWNPRVQARFRVDPSSGKASIAEVNLSAPGVQATGVGEAGCAGKGVDYRIQAQDLVVDLAELWQNAPGMLAPARGRVAVVGLEVSGGFPDRPPRLKSAGRVEPIGPISFRGMHLVAPEGRWQLEGDLEHIKGKAALTGRVQREQGTDALNLAITGSLEGDLRQGNFALEPLQVEADRLGTVDLKGTLQRWGETSAELVMRSLDVDLTALNQLIASLQPGIEVDALERPSLRLTLAAARASWEALTQFGSLAFRIRGRSTILQEAKVRLIGHGIQEIEGATAVEVLSVEGHRLEHVTAAFALRDDGLIFKDLKASAYGGQLKMDGMITLALADDLLKMPELSLTVGDRARIFLTAILPLGTEPSQARSFKLRLPATQTAALQKALPHLLPKLLNEAHLAGTLEAKIELTGDQVQGEVRLEAVASEGTIMTLQGLSGRVPVAGRLDVPSAAAWEGWPDLSEKTYDLALQDFQRPPPSPSLTISSVSFAGLELKDLAMHFSPRESAIAIDYVAFQGLGGRGWARGVIDLFGGSLELALLLDGLSVREVSQRFPPIRGAISGKVNGMLEFSLPLFRPSRATGKARFWSVDSEEPREISKALLERLGAQGGAIVNLLAIRGDRPYDHGLLEVTLKDRSLTFHHLELSNTTLLIKDLEIKVVPPYNTIAIQDLFDTIQETWERVQK